jgi:uncharacterized protein (TIGR02266 family)
MMDGPHEKRSHPRVELVLKVSYADRDSFLADTTSNAGPGGLFLTTDKEFALGEILHLELSFPGLLEPLSAHARVMWRRGESVGDEQVAGYGLEFVSTNRDEVDKLREVMCRLTVAQPPASAPQPAPEPVEKAVFRALLVEDNPLVREMLHFAVRKYHERQQPGTWTLELLEADNGQAAIDQLSGRSVDLAIIDYFMPVMNGLQLLRWIRADETHAKLPVIVVSAGGAEVRSAVEQAGADLFLDKPLMLSKVLESINKLLSLVEGGGEDGP